MIKTSYAFSYSIQLINLFIYFRLSSDRMADYTDELHVPYGYVLL